MTPTEYYAAHSSSAFFSNPGVVVDVPREHAWEATYIRARVRVPAGHVRLRRARGCPRRRPHPAGCASLGCHSIVHSGLSRPDRGLCVLRKSGRHDMSRPVRPDGCRDCHTRKRILASVLVRSGHPFWNSNSTPATRALICWFTSRPKKVTLFTKTKMTSDRKTGATEFLVKPWVPCLTEVTLTFRLSANRARKVTGRKSTKP